MSLKALRAALASELTSAGVRTYPGYPDSFSAPGGVVLAGDRYLEYGETFNGWVIRYTVFLFVEDSPRAEDELDDLVTLAVLALEDYDIESVDSAVIDTEQNRRLVAAKLILTTEVTREELI